MFHFGESYVWRTINLVFLMEFYNQWLAIDIGKRLWSVSYSIQDILIYHWSGHVWLIFCFTIIQNWQAVFGNTNMYVYLIQIGNTFCTFLVINPLQFQNRFGLETVNTSAIKSKWNNNQKNASGVLYSKPGILDVLALIKLQYSYC